MAASSSVCLKSIPYSDACSRDLGYQPLDDVTIRRPRGDRHEALGVKWWASGVLLKLRAQAYPEACIANLDHFVEHVN